VAVAFNRIGRPAYKRIVASKLQSRCLSALRDALLPRLLSGEMRVSEAERLAEGGGGAITQRLARNFIGTFSTERL
jgi:hypothetical protein